MNDLLPRVVRLIGAEGAAIYRTGGELIGRTGVTRDAVAGEESHALVPGMTQHGPDRLTVSVPGGRLELFTSPYTPYFGRDEFQLVRNVAALVYVTLERTYAHAREVAAREALDEAQRIGLFTRLVADGPSRPATWTPPTRCTGCTAWSRATAS